MSVAERARNLVNSIKSHPILDDKPPKAAKSLGSCLGARRQELRFGNSCCGCKYERPRKGLVRNSTQAGSTPHKKAIGCAVYKERMFEVPC